ncbi:MAG: hypothetical protein RLY16_1871 [Bacteroidota bacterium]
MKYYTSTKQIQFKSAQRFKSSLILYFLSLFSIGIFTVNEVNALGAPKHVVTDTTDPAPITGRLVSNLYAMVNSNSRLADGNMVMFDNVYSNGVDPLDVRKMMNFGENLALKRDNIILAVERRAFPGVADTIFYDLSNLNNLTYRLEIVPTNLHTPTRIAFLQDLYLNTQTLISLTDTTKHLFVVNGNAGSKDRGRFRIVINDLSGGALPVRFNALTAGIRDQQICVQWTAAEELFVKNYQVETSLDGRNFIATGAPLQPQTIGDGTYKTFVNIPSGNYVYFRIKSLDIDGSINFSHIIKLTLPNLHKNISVLNPVKQNTIEVKINSLTAGNCQFELLNLNGAVVYHSTQSLTAGLQTILLNPQAKLSTGYYFLKIRSTEHNSTHKLLIQ